MDDPAAGRGCLPWSIRSLRAAGESLAKPKSLSNPSCPPSQQGDCFETRSSIASLKNEEVVYFQGTSSIPPSVLTARSQLARSIQRNFVRRVSRLRQEYFAGLWEPPRLGRPADLLAI